jgi:WhiB family redox-sensing transcriptional regulator
VSYTAAYPPPPGPWVEHAACRGDGHHRWFPEHGRGMTTLRAVCAACPVRRPCLEYALKHVDHGVWGGTSEKQRRAIRRRRRAL